MTYQHTVTLKDGTPCLLRHAVKEDGAAMLDLFIQTHIETDYLLSYPDEITFTVEKEEAYLQSKLESDNEIEIVAEVEGKIVGSAGFSPVGRVDKVRHRADFGIGILKDYWGLEIGRALTGACIDTAKAAGYTLLELTAVAENEHALALYRKAGFVEYGRNPKGFRSRHTGFQEVVYMQLEL